MSSTHSIPPSDSTSAPGPSPTRALRLLLINPTIDGKPEHLHIGLATVGSYVRLHSSHHVDILDFLAARRRWRRKLRDCLHRVRPDVVGIYISTPYFPSARLVADEIKQLRPGLTIVAGGHHATLEPEAVMGHPAFDMLLIGEGEKPTLQLLNALAADQPLDSVPGLWWRQGNAIHKTPKDTLLAAKAMPPADWSLHDEHTLRTAFYFWGILPVMASRGCAAHCSFCSITRTQRLYPNEQFLRHREPKEVVDEIAAHYERYHRWGLRIVFFYDLNFLCDPEWLGAFTEAYRSRGLQRVLKWSAYTRADHVSSELVSDLADSGCVNLRVGIEAANPTMRNGIYAKDVSQPQLLAALATLKQHGIAVTGYFMAGGPGERPQWLLESLALSRQAGIEFPVFFLYKPLAGTAILKRAEELGSAIIPESLEHHSDYLSGVNMTHEHVRAWQLKAFVRLTQLAFGPPLLLRQLRRRGPGYFVEAARYLARAVRMGYPAQMAANYFVFYGADHLADPIHLNPELEPSLGWRALMQCSRLWLR